MFENYGHCPCCNAATKFVAATSWWRDDYLCTVCDSIPRERALMYCIERFFPSYKDMVIHESSPVLDRGASQRLRAEVPAYIPSQFYPTAASGAIVNGVRCENLEKLSFDDASVDLHISQDVFEHLFNPAAAFREIARTLKPGGAHVFTTPLVEKTKPTQFCARMDESGDVIQLIDPPDYHLNPVSQTGSLVTVRWGYDITAYIAQETGLFTTIVVLDNLEFGIRAEYIEILITYKR